MAWTDKYYNEDRRVWRELMKRAAERRNGIADAEPTAGGGEPSEEQPVKHDRPYEDPDLGTIAYDSNGKLLKPAKQPKPKGKPLARGTRDKLWSAAGGIIGTALGGGVGGAIGSMLASPRFRRNAINHSEPTANTAPSPRAVHHDDPLDEPFDKDGDKTLAQKFLSKAEEFQAGKGRSEYHDDYVWDRDSGKWIPPEDQNESIKSVITEALKQFRPKI